MPDRDPTTAAVCPECEGRGEVPNGLPCDGPEPCPSCSDAASTSDYCEPGGPCEVDCVDGCVDKSTADIPHTGFGDCGCADCWPADPIGCSDAALVRHAWEHSTACGVFTDDDARCTCKEDAA